MQERELVPRPKTKKQQVLDLADQDSTLTPRQIAEKVGVSRNMVYLYLRSGKEMRPQSERIARMEQRLHVIESILYEYFESRRMDTKKLKKPRKPRGEPRVRD